MEIFLAAVLLGLAYLRTRSLALPIGLHLGWNWTQGNVLGFGVSGYDYAGWLKPIFQGKAEWLTGGTFGPESSIFSPLVSLVVFDHRTRGSGLTVRSARPRPASSQNLSVAVQPAGISSLTMT